MADNYPGDSGPVWEVGYEDVTGEAVVLDSNYVCKLVVVPDGAAQPTVDRGVTLKSEDSTRFIARLSEAETGDLGPGVHKVGIWIINSNAGIQRRRQLTLNLMGDGLPLPT